MAATLLTLTTLMTVPATVATAAPTRTTTVVAASSPSPSIPAPGNPNGTAPAKGDAGNPAKPGPLGFTVSWTSTTSPVQIKPGGKATGKFWVTNRTGHTLPFDIIPATAIPGDNGALSTVQKPDGRFVKIVLSVTHFVARPHQTKQINVTVTAPKELGPGIYLVPAIVKPMPTAKTKAIHIQQQAVALATFQVPGPITTRMSASFVPPAGTVQRKIPGLPPIQLTDTGRQNLRVLSRSSSSLYAYYEITATHGPFGTPTFAGHTQGAPGDLRAQPSLYFPGRSRSYPVQWKPAGPGIGLASFTAYVSYHPTPTTTRQTEASASILTISPLWLLAFVALFAAAAIRPRRGRPSQRSSRHADRGPVKTGSPTGRGVLTGVLTLGTLFTALLGAVLPFTPIAATAAICAAAFGSGRLRNSYAWGVIVRSATGVALAGATALTILTATAGFSPQLAASAVAGAGAWALLILWTPAHARPARRRARQTATRHPPTAATPIIDV